MGLRRFPSLPASPASSRIPRIPGRPKVAIVVRDDAHGLGLGADLVEGVLARGRQEGVRTAVA